MLNIPRALNRVIAHMEEKEEEKKEDTWWMDLREGKKEHMLVEMLNPVLVAVPRVGSPVAEMRYTRGKTAKEGVVMQEEKTMESGTSELLMRELPNMLNLVARMGMGRVGSRVSLPMSKKMRRTRIMHIILPLIYLWNSNPKRLIMEVRSKANMVITETSGRKKRPPINGKKKRPPIIGKKKRPPIIGKKKRPPIIG